MTPETRQVRRANERRATKMPPGEISRTSGRWLGRTKGYPFSRQKLVRIEPAKPGKPAVFHTRSNTRRSCPRPVKATVHTVDWFFPSLPENMKQAMLGVFS